MSDNESNSANDGQSRLTVALERKIYDAAAWFCDNPNCSDIEQALRELVAEAVNDACAKLCDDLYDAGDCAVAIRMRSNNGGEPTRAGRSPERQR